MFFATTTDVWRGIRLWLNSIAILAGGLIAAPNDDSDGDFIRDGEEAVLATRTDLLQVDLAGISLPAISPSNPHSFTPLLSDYTALARLFEAGRFAHDVLGNDVDNDGLPDWLGSAGNADDDLNGIRNFVQLEMGMSLTADALPLADTDGDGMSDAFELATGLNKELPEDAVLDADADGVFNFEEYFHGTSPVRNYSLGKHEPVKVRWVRPGTAPGSWNVYRYSDNGTDYLITDYQWAGGVGGVWLPADAWPVKNGPEALPVTPVAILDAAAVSALPANERPNYQPFEVIAPVTPSDWDGDGLSNLIEYQILGEFGYAGAPLTPYEVATALRDADMDDNGVPDGLDDWDGDGLGNLYELTMGLKPWLQDSDGNGIPDKEDQLPGSSTSPTLHLVITSPASGDVLD